MVAKEVPGWPNVALITDPDMEGVLDTLAPGNLPTVVLADVFVPDANLEHNFPKNYLGKLLITFC